MQTYQINEFCFGKDSPRNFFRALACEADDSFSPRFSLEWRCIERAEKELSFAGRRRIISNSDRSRLPVLETGKLSLCQGRSLEGRSSCGKTWAGSVRYSETRVRAMLENRQARNTNWRMCGAAALIVGALVGFGDARAETISRFGEVTANAPDEILDRPAVNAVTAPARPRQESSLTGNPLWDVALRSLQETRARPIFSPSRRPPSPPVVATLPTPMPKPPPPQEPDRVKLTLLGTVIGASDSLGVFTDETSKEVIRIRTGESHDGWTLRSVQRRAASFEKNDREMTLALSPPASEPSAPSVGVVASRTGGAGTSGNDRGAANLAANRAHPVALTFPASAPTTLSAQKIRREIRQDILSIGVQN